MFVQRRSRSKPGVKENKFETFFRQRIFWLVTNSQPGLYLSLLIVFYSFCTSGVVLLAKEIISGKPPTLLKNKVQKFLTLEQAVILETSLNRTTHHFVNALRQLINLDEIPSISRISRERDLVYLRS